MAVDLKQILNYAWMSQASYRDFAGVVARNQVQFTAALIGNEGLAKDKKFADQQAIVFTDPTSGFSFIDYHPNDFQIN